MAPTSGNGPHRMDAQEYASFGVARARGCVVVTAAGEIDVLSSRGLRDAVKVAVELSHRIIIDLSQVNLLDSAGLAVLVEAQALVRDRDGTVALVGATGVVSAALRVSRLAETFLVRDDVADAVTAINDL